MDEKAMREKELQFLMLCGPLEDAIDLIDAGKVDSARALLERMLDRVEEALGVERASTFHSHFSHIQFTPNGGEKCHRTFDDDDGYGPDWDPLAAAIARRGWSPTFICESAGTQAEDALTMKRVYQEQLKRL